MPEPAIGLLGDIQLGIERQAGAVNHGQQAHAQPAPPAVGASDHRHRSHEGAAAAWSLAPHAVQSPRTSPLDLIQLSTDYRPEAAEVLTEAFLDNPVWTCIGPKRESLRRHVARHFHRLALRHAQRYGGPSWCALRDGKVVGVAVTFAHGHDYPPPMTWLTEGTPFILAGPGGMLRAARVDVAMKRGHPREPYFYLWFLAVDPPAQRQGVGRTLLGQMLAEARARQLPVYLETTKAANVPYYASHGFRLTGEAAMPRGARVWYMWHDAGLIA